MYPVTCAGGYAVPLKAGSFEIVGLRATVNSPASASQIILYDDGGIPSGDKFGRILPSDFDPGTIDSKRVTQLCNIKGIANLDANLEVLFPEPIKTRFGTSVSILSNVVPGSVELYVR